MRQQMQNDFVAPPRLIVIKIVLRKTAGVHDAELRTDARPVVRRRLTAIIKTRPDKSAGEPWTRGKKWPPVLRRLTIQRLAVVSGHITVFRVVRVNAARGDSAGLLRADFRLRRMLAVIIVRVLAEMIVPAASINDAVNAVKHVT